jgi:GTP cyclohydrolase I
MSLDSTKTDGKLGQEIYKHLLDKGVETPMLTQNRPTADKISEIRDHFTDIMGVLNLDLTDDSLQDTPNRVAKMFVNEVFWGLDYDNFPKITPFENKMQYDSMILERGISVKSMCEHHFVTFNGTAHIAYIPKPDGVVLGLSKLNRIVEFFSRRPQVQERLTEQVYHALSYILDTENVAVMIQAKHFCVVQRGVEDMNADMVTSRLGGEFRNNEVKMEFLKLISL